MCILKLSDYYVYFFAKHIITRSQLLALFTYKERATPYDENRWISFETVKKFLVEKVRFDY